MRRAMISATALIAVVVSVGMAGAVAAKTTTLHFHGTIIGAQVSSNENVYDLRGLGVRGAAIQIFKANAKGTGGTDTITGYYGNGTAVSVDTYTNSLPDANGIVTIQGAGHFVRGTGAYKHVRGHYTFKGTFDTKHNHLKFKLIGTERF